jgi:predicted phosphodiesterase
MIEQIIKKYSEFYEGKPYTVIADRILEEETVALSHRTLRRMISEYVNSRAEEYCCGNPMDCNSACLKKESECCGDKPVCQNCPKVEEVKNTVYDNVWNKESTLEYFKNQEESSIFDAYSPNGTGCSFNKPALQPYVGNLDNVLVIGDTHEPFCREGYLAHCREMQEKFDCGTVIHIGDEVDNHALSYHESNSEADSVAGEFTKAMIRMKEWYRVFPEVTVIVGNHSALPFRKANTAGLSNRFLKAYEDIWEAPKGWSWKINHEFLGVYYTHNASAKPLNMAVNRRQSVVAGHHHTVASIEWNVSKKDKIFGMLTGCGIDDSSYAFSYAKDNAKKSIISCAVVLKGEIPIILPMSL